MDRDTFINYVNELDTRQSKHPVLYKLWMVWLFVSVFIYLSLMIVLSLIFIVFAYLLAIAFPLIPLFFLFLAALMLFFSISSFIRILLFRYDKPEGFELNRKDAPVLFDRINQISSALKTPRIHHVLLNNDFNASATQLPRASVFGAYRNYLMIGTPLLFSLDCEHFDAVLAHEMAHISKYHGRMGCWIAKMAEPILKIMENTLFINVFYGTFLHRFQYWFMNRLSASVPVLRRANELEAQKFAARIVGEKTVIDSYGLMQILSAYWHKDLRQSYFRMALELDEPAPVIEHMKNTLKDRLPFDILRMRYTSFKNMTTEFDDSHPCYSDVAAKLGLQPSVPPLPGEPAFLTYLTEQVFADDYDKFWIKEYSHIWRNQRMVLQDRQTKLDSLRAKQRSISLSEDDMVKTAGYTQTLYGPEAALPLYRQIREKNPYQPDASFHIGMDELSRFEASGVDKVRQAISRNIWFYGEGYPAIRNYYLGTDQVQEAKAYTDSQKKNADMYKSYHVHCHVLSDDMVYSNVKMDESVVNQLTVYINHSPLIQKAYLTRKERKGNRDVYVIVLQWRTGGQKRNKRLKEVVEDIRSIAESVEADVIIRTNKDFYAAYYHRFKKLFCVKIK